MTDDDSNAPLSSLSQSTSLDHHSATDALWWFDLCTMAGRKCENQDSVLITTCLPYLSSSLQASGLQASGLQTNSNQTTNNQTNVSQESPIQTDIALSKAAVITTAVEAGKPKAPSAKQRPLLVILADGVSACQFPKQASRQAVTIIARKITHGLMTLAQQQSQSNLLDQSNGLASSNSPLDLVSESPSADFDDEQVASLIKAAVNKANDALYFSQAYQRVPPLLSTVSGVLCIGDRIHLFHTGDSRIYRVGADSLTVISHDHRIHHGQDKGALSAALGADTTVDLQQSVFTLHQNESLALMTDGVFEHIDATELQFELCSASTKLFEHQFQQQYQSQHSFINISKPLCQYAFNEGSNDNLTMVTMGMTALGPLTSSVLASTANQNMTQKANLTTDINKADEVELEEADHPQIDHITRYKLPIGLQVGEKIDGFVVTEIIARTARSEVYLVEDLEGRQFVLKSPSVNTVGDGDYLREFLKERKIGLSLSKHRRAGESAYNQTDPNRVPDQLPSSNRAFDMGLSARPSLGTSAQESGLLRYYPVPASSPYLYHLTEYIEGESLRVFMDRNAPCDVWQVYDLLTKIGMAVRVMHRNYLLHQDIKPENILLTKSGAVKLIDFGSASSSILKDSTRPPNGDLHYAAPEYYSDAPKGVHSDLFSIAVIGYELLTGQRPFSAQALMTPSQSLIVPVAALHQNNVPPTSQQALLRALHSHPNARYQAIGEFLQDFNPDNLAAQSDPKPLIVRNPLLVWHGICFIELVIIIVLLAKLLLTG